MFLWHKKEQIKMLGAIDVSRHRWCNDALLFEVKNGKGALCWGIQSVKDDYYGGRDHYELLLNNVPILQENKPPCSTCAGLIATGYGIENADCAELKAISCKINSLFSGLENAFDATKPLLGLLQDGLYILADCNVYPSDGNGHFFWNVPNEFATNPTTACVFTEEYDCVSGIPAFLYPSQGTDQFNLERVEHYSNLLSNKQTFPRAIAYFTDEFSSVLLDGHHKAAACACAGAQLPCLVIMPCRGSSYKQSATMEMVKDKVFFGRLEIDCLRLNKKQRLYVDNIYKSRKRTTVKPENYGIIKRVWEKCYRDSHKYYPDVFEFAEGAALGFPPITEDLLKKCFAETTKNNLRVLRYAIQFLYKTDKDQALKLALRVAKMKLDSKLTLVAFKTLALYKNNNDVEQFFIDHIIEDLDPHSALRIIADSYWDNE